MNEWMNECFRALFGPDAFRPLVEYDAVSIGELLTTFRMSLLPLYSDFAFSRRYWWSLSLLRDMTPYRLANFYRLLDDIPAYIFMVSAAQEKCIDANFFGSKLVNIGSFLPGDTQSSQQTRIACSSLLWQRDVK